MKRIIKCRKKDPSDDYDTEYLDVDSLLNMYLEYFRAQKRKQQKALQKQFLRTMSNN